MPFIGVSCQRQSWRICYFIVDFSRMMAMGFKETEREWMERTKRFVKAELKWADVTYEELAGRLREMGLEETKVSIASKLSRGGFGATFFIAAMKAIGREQVNLADL
jgi:hypothetical protein